MGVERGVIGNGVRDEADRWMDGRNIFAWFGVAGAL